MSESIKPDGLTLRAGFTLLLGSLILGQSLPVGAQTPPPPIPEPTMTQPDDANRTFSGEVENYLLSPLGYVQGLILNNGLQVNFPPHLGMSVAKTVKVGDRITITGHAGNRYPLGQMVMADSITNSQTGRTIEHEPPESPPMRLSNSNYNNISVQGRAKTWIIGQEGEIHGVILSDGTQVWVPASIGSKISNLAKQDVTVQAEGTGIRNNYGQALEAYSLTVEGQTIEFSEPSDNKPPIPPSEGMLDERQIMPPDAMPSDQPRIMPPDEIPGQPPVPSPTPEEIPNFQP
jgi:hypothetical protein